MYDYLIVGAGLSGCTYAYMAKRAGKKCLVLERKDRIGGACATREQFGIMVHLYGAHIFKTNNKVLYDKLDEISPLASFVNTPKAINGGRMFSLPINMHTFHELWGVVTPAEAREMIEAQRVPCEKPRNLEEHVLSMVGRDVYEALIKGYTEKQWGRPCTELPPSTIRRIPVRFVYDNNYYDAEYQGIPVYGYSALMGEMLEGVETHLNVDFDAAWIRSNPIAKTVVYTGAMDELFDFKYGVLEYRSLEFETSILGGNQQGVAVVNYTGLEVPYTRKIEHKNFVRSKGPEDVKSCTLVTTETPVNWEPGKERFYPMEDEGNRALYEKYRRELPENFIPLGRLAQYRYIDMAEAVAGAMNCARLHMA